VLGYLSNLIELIPLAVWRGLDIFIV